MNDQTNNNKSCHPKQRHVSAAKILRIDGNNGTGSDFGSPLHPQLHRLYRIEAFSEMYGMREGQGFEGNEMNWLILIPIALALAAIYLWRRKKRDVFQVNGVTCSRKTLQTTPNGVQVYSFKGLPFSSLRIIDDSLTDLFIDALAEGYTAKLTHGAYTIYIPADPCTLSPVDKCPSFKVIGGTGYDGSEYDQDPRPGYQAVLAAEMVISPQDGSYIVCPDEVSLANATRYGAEHILLLYNDMDYYQRSQIHATILHPLLPRAGR